MQGVALLLIGFVDGFWPWFITSALLGLGTAMVYPTLLAAVADVAPPTWRGAAVGVYRLCPGSGYAFGALPAGFLADAFGLRPAIVVTGLIALASSAHVAVRMPETRPAVPEPEWGGS